MKKLIIINTILLLLFILLPEKPIINIVEEVIEELETEIIEEPEIELTRIDETISTRGNIEREVEKTEVTEISQKGIDLIKKFEGCHLQAYRLTGETNWTIGYGHNSNKVYQGQTITQEEAENLLKEDLKKYTKYVLDLKLDLNQNQLDALVSFTYNCGQGNLKKLTKNRTLEEIAQHMTAYTGSSSESFRQGLLNRRNMEKQLFLEEM